MLPPCSALPKFRGSQFSSRRPSHLPSPLPCFHCSSSALSPRVPRSRPSPPLALPCPSPQRSAADGNSPFVPASNRYRRSEGPPRPSSPAGQLLPQTTTGPRRGEGAGGRLPCPVRPCCAAPRCRPEAGRPRCSPACAAPRCGPCRRPAARLAASPRCAAARRAGGPPRRLRGSPQPPGPAPPPPPAAAGAAPPWPPPAPTTPTPAPAHGPARPRASPRPGDAAALPLRRPREAAGPRHGAARPQRAARSSPPASGPPSPAGSGRSGCGRAMWRGRRPPRPAAGFGLGVVAVRSRRRHLRKFASQSRLQEKAFSRR